jgi:hypothetical protein
MAIKRPDTPLAATVTDSVKKTPVFFNKRKAIREMRTVAKKNPDGTTESHKMSWTGDPNKKRGNYAVFPTITPLKGKEKSSDPKDWTTQTAKEAEAKGELIKVNSKRRAEKLAAGAWKKGEDRKEAMREYRANKRAEKASKKK